MVLQVMDNQSLIIEVKTLQAADTALVLIEDSMPEAFAQIGIHASASGTDRIINVFKKHGSKVDNFTLFTETLRYFPDAVALKRAMSGLQAAGWIKRTSFDAATGTEMFELVRPDLRMGSNGPKTP
jgi:hypothetical protein